MRLRAFARRTGLVLLAMLTLGSISGQDKVLRVTEKELRGAAKYKVDPEYPAVARQIRLTGDVELEVGLDPSGAVEDVKVLRGNTLLVGSSVQAMRKWKFTPFRADGQPVHAVGPIKFSFQI